jgi:hypothetical protein
MGGKEEVSIQRKNKSLNYRPLTFVSFEEERKNKIKTAPKR